PRLFAGVVVGRLRQDQRALLVLDLPVPRVKVAPLDNQGSALDMLQSFVEEEGGAEARSDNYQFIMLFVDVTGTDAVDLHATLSFRWQPLGSSHDKPPPRRLCSRCVLQ